MAICNKMIEGNTVSYACSLDVDDGPHAGPCATPENDRSVRARKRWLTQVAADQAEERRRQASGLAQFQGPAQTTAQRYTENPTPVPLTREERDAQHREREAVQAAEQHQHDDQPPHGHEPPQPVVTSQPHPSRPWEFGIDVPVEPGTPGVDIPVSMSQQPEPTKQRPGDQPLPTPTGGEYVQDRIVAKAQVLVDRGQMAPQEFEAIRNTMAESKRVGIERYGSALQTFNGRDTLQDAEDEARDLFVYLSSLNQAREADREVLVPIVRDVLLVQWQANADAQRKATPETWCQEFAEIAVDTILKATGPLSGGTG